VLCVPFVFCLLPGEASAQLIDRVLARVGTNAVTLTDVRSALGLGLVEAAPGDDSQAAAVQRMIDRQLMLDEVARFAPPEPSDAEVGEEVAAMKARAGPELDVLMGATGLDEAKLQQLARETLRIRAYLAQRFGTSAQVTEDEARKYYEEHPDEFLRDGVRMSFEEAETLARQRASAERLRATIDQWVRDLRTRAEVVIVGNPAAPG
jgi:hypothetical protein